LRLPLPVASLLSWSYTDVNLMRKCGS